MKKYKYLIIVIITATFFTSISNSQNTENTNIISIQKIKTADINVDITETWSASGTTNDRIRISDLSDISEVTHTIQNVILNTSDYRSTTGNYGHWLANRTFQLNAPSSEFSVEGFIPFHRQGDHTDSWDGTINFYVDGTLIDTKVDQVTSAGNFNFNFQYNGQTANEFTLEGVFEQDTEFPFDRHPLWNMSGPQPGGAPCYDFDVFETYTAGEVNFQVTEDTSDFRYALIEADITLNYYCQVESVFTIQSSEDVVSISDDQPLVGRSGDNISLIITDAIEITEVEYQWDLGDWKILEEPYILSFPSGDGNHSLKIKAVDNNNNEYFNSFTFETDDTAPKITFNIPEGAYVIEGSDIEIEINENVVLSQYKWDDDIYIDLPPDNNVKQPNKIGVHQLHIKARDVAGNQIEVTLETITALKAIAVFLGYKLMQVGIALFVGIFGGSLGLGIHWFYKKTKDKDARSGIYFGYGFTAAFSLGISVQLIFLEYLITMVIGSLLLALFYLWKQQKTLNSKDLSKWLLLGLQLISGPFLGIFMILKDSLFGFFALMYIFSLEMFSVGMLLHYTGEEIYEFKKTKFPENYNQKKLLSDSITLAGAAMMLVLSIVEVALIFTSLMSLLDHVASILFTTIALIYAGYFPKFINAHKESTHFIGDLLRSSSSAIAFLMYFVV